MTPATAATKKKQMKHLKFKEHADSLFQLAKRVAYCAKKTDKPANSYNEYVIRKTEEIEKLVEDIKTSYSNEALRPNRDKTEDVLNDLSKLICTGLTLGAHISPRGISENTMFRVRAGERLAERTYLYYGNMEKIRGSWIVNFPDIPECLTEGSTKEEAISMASDALKVAIGGYQETGRELPLPSSYRRVRRNKLDWKNPIGIKTTLDISPPPSAKAIKAKKVEEKSS